MLENKEQYIFSLLQEDEKFNKLEGKLIKFLPEKIADNGEDENVNILMDIEKVIVEKAYLKGYSDGMKEFDKMKENPEKYLTLDQMYKVIDGLGIEKPGDK